MTYFLAGIDVAKGTMEDDVSENRPYYELGWEITSTHFDAKRMKKLGLIDSGRDTIVTCTGREFLYGAEFQNVLNYDEFERLCVAPESVVSLMSRYGRGYFPQDYYTGDRHTPNARYKYLDEDRDAITNFDLAGVSFPAGDDPYCCVSIRKRAHDSYRNVNDDLALPLLHVLGKNYSTVFVVGRNLEHLAHEPGVTLVDLRSFAALIQSERCQLIVGSLTGPMHIAALVSKAPACIVFNHDCYDIDARNHPVLMGKCIRLSKSRFLFWDPLQLPNIGSGTAARLNGEQKGGERGGSVTAG